MAENLKLKNKKIKSSIVILLMMFAANICFAAPQQEADDFFKDAINIEAVEKTPPQNQDNTTNPISKSDNKFQDFINNFTESSKVYSEQALEFVKTNSIKINDFAEQVTKGNKMLAKILLISVLSIISIIFILLILVVFKLLFKKKKKNPFAINVNNQNVFESDVNENDEIEDTEDVNAQQPQQSQPVNVVNSVETPLEIDSAIQEKNQIINEPSPKDIKSAVKLFIKITS